MSDKKDFSKRFWLFGYSDYYPNGGLNDFKDSWETYEEAYNALVIIGPKKYWECAQILDIKDKQLFNYQLNETKWELKIP